MDSGRGDGKIEGAPLKILGIDLAGSPKRPTGACLMDANLSCACSVLFSDDEIVNLAASELPDVIAVDAPLSLPPGRESIDEKSGSHLRECDRELIRRKIKFFPVTLGPMRMLTKRGLMLKKVFEGMGLKTIEVYPGAAQDIMGVSRQKYPGKLLRGLRRLGIKGLHNRLNVHELDAATSSYVGFLYLKGEAEKLEDESGGGIFLPRRKTF
jgi:uncharacterized protein